MGSTARLAALVSLMGLAVALVAAYEPTSQELQINRLLLKKWRSDPEHYARLKQDLTAFLKLPESDQERLERFDRELHEESPQIQERLFRILDRYATWVSHLSEEDRIRLHEIKNPLERKFLVMELRQNEWVTRLPKVDRERIESLPRGEGRERALAELRREERERRFQVVHGLARHEEPADLKGEVDPKKPEAPKSDSGKLPVDKTKKYQPVRMGEFPREVRDYYRLALRPLLSEKELGYLEGLEKQTDPHWPDLAVALKRAADQHPIKFPPAREGPRMFDRNYPVRRFGEIPPEWAKHIQKLKSADSKGITRKERMELNQVNDRWPEFALNLFHMAQANQWELTKRQLGPCKPEEFALEIDRFLKNDLATALKDDAQAKDRLKKAEGHWPEYPQTVMELAGKCKLKIPLMSLPEIPGQPEFWTKLTTNTAQK